MSTEPKLCALCGHPEDFRECGSGTGARGEYLCHTDDHSCYHRWTVYGERPAGQPTSPESTLMALLGDMGTPEEIAAFAASRRDQAQR